VHGDTDGTGVGTVVRAGGADERNGHARTIAQRTYEHADLVTDHRIVK
jgi:hypothetical protein